MKMRLAATFASLLLVVGGLTTAELATQVPAHAAVVLACGSNPYPPYDPITTLGPHLTGFGVEAADWCIFSGPPYVWDFYKLCIAHSLNGVDNWIVDTTHCDTNDILNEEHTYAPVRCGDWYYAGFAYYYPSTLQTNTIQYSDNPSFIEDNNPGCVPG